MSGPRTTRRFTSGDNARALINPTNGFREQQLRRGVKPKNHQAANRAAIRDAEARNRVRKAQEEGKTRDAANRFKMERFRNVEGRIRRGFEEQENRAPSPRALERAAERRAAVQRRADRRRSSTAGTGAGVAPPAAPADSPAKPYVPRQKTKPRAPRRDEVVRMPQRAAVDFVAENRADAVRMRPPSRDAAQSEAGSPRLARPGEVPAYLQERKEQWRRDEEQRRREAGDPDCPPGTELMPDAERRETLRVLRESEEEVRRQMSRLPLRVETPSMQRRKEQIEAKLQELSDAIEIFSKDKVYIARDE